MKEMLITVTLMEARVTGPPSLTDFKSQMGLLFF